jgi:hypothetical protein
MGRFLFCAWAFIKNWLDCRTAKFYSVPIFGKLLATLANPLAAPQTPFCAARTLRRNSLRSVVFIPYSIQSLYVLTEVR